MPRSISRVRLVLPAQKPGDPRAPATVEALAARIADALAVAGIQVRQQVAGSVPDGAPRADAALWLPDPDGVTPPPDPKAASARVQVAYVVAVPDSGSRSAHLARYDALLAPAAIAPALQQAVKRAAGRDTPVVTARLPGAPAMAREGEKALRALGTAGTAAHTRIALVDVRDGFDGDAERVVVQLGLRAQEGAVVLLAPHDERARARVRSLCERHAVNAWLVSGSDGFAQSVGALDLFVGRPTWDEALLLALHRVDVCAFQDGGAAGGAPLTRALIAARLVDDKATILQLAATLDRKLADPGALDARGTALGEALFGPERELVDALAHVEPLPDGALASAWEAVGPHASRAAAAGVVEARDANAPPEPSRAQKIEDQLEALKERLRSERGSA